MPAKSKSLLKRAGKKKPRVSKETERQVNAKYWGKTPPPVEDRARFLSWCSYMVEPDQAREWGEEYARTLGLTLRGVPDKWINASACYRARMKALGAEFNPEQDRLLSRHFKEMADHRDEVDEDKPPQPTIADRVAEKFHDVMGEIEGMLDDGLPAGFSIRSWLTERGVSTTVARRIPLKLMPRIEELEEAIEGGDPQVREAYFPYSKPDLVRMQRELMDVVEDTLQMIDNEKRARPPRKAKPVSVEKRVVHMRDSYQAYSKDWDISSLDPVKVVGSQEVWTLNTKYKLLTVYRAESHGGRLDVARCKVSGFNRNDSHTYRLGRGKKSEAVVAEALKSSRAKLKGLVLGLKEAPLQERVNENTLILRVL